MLVYHNGLSTAGLFGLIAACCSGWAPSSRPRAAMRSSLLFAAIGLVDLLVVLELRQDRDPRYTRRRSHRAGTQMYRIVRELRRRPISRCPALHLAHRCAECPLRQDAITQHAAVCCTEGILRLLDERELQGAGARAHARLQPRHPHRLGRGGDRRRHFTVGQMLSRMMFGGGSNNREGGGGNPVALLAMAILAPFAAGWSSNWPSATPASDGTTGAGTGGPRACQALGAARL